MSKNLDDDFHVFKIIYTSSNKQATAFVNDTQINQYTFSEEPSGKRIGLFIHEYYDTEFTFDWIRVRKYASKEPSVSVGEEETAG